MPPATPGTGDKTGRRSSGEIHTRTVPAEKRSRKRPPEGERTKAQEARSRGAKTAKPRSQNPKSSNPKTASSEPQRPKSRAQKATAGKSPVGTPPARTRVALGNGPMWGRGLIALVSVAVLVCTGYAWNSMTGLQNKITQLGGLGLGGEDGAIDILLVGTDSRTDAKGNPLSEKELKLLKAGNEVATNTDTILLIRIPDDGSSATAISIPRDSYVEVPGIGKTKINAAYGTTREGVRAKEVEAGKSEESAERDGTQAGRKALIDTVANLTGVKVDHYAEVGLLGFVLLTNAVGGVDVCLKAPARDPFTGAKFRAGRQTLNGSRALSFVRQRHGLPRGDLDRIARQQAFMASLTAKMLSANLLADPGKLSELENAVSRSVVIDDNWDIIGFAEQLRELSGGKVKFATIPVVTDQGWSEDGQQSVVEVDPGAVQAFTTNLLNPKRDGSVDRGDYTVEVVNAGTIDGLAGNVSNILVNKGFQAGKTSSGPVNIKDSVVYASEADDAARQLAKDLGGVRVEEDKSLGDKKFKVVLTNTYAGPGSIADTGAQEDNTPASEREAGPNRAPITAGTNGPNCVN